MDIIRKTKEYACKMHDLTHQRYGKHPYSYHLEMVACVGFEYLDNIHKKEDQFDVLAGCWAHDLIEDAQVSYNDVKKNTNLVVAEYAYVLTNEKGRNRAERANAKYYYEIKIYKHAAFIKLCDRIANVRYSKKNKSPQFKMYKKEYSHFKDMLFDGRYLDLWDELEQLMYK